MPLSIGVNLRVTGHCNQGGRKYMEDMFSVAYQQTPDDKDLEYAFFGIFDGHGGGEAATFAKEHLMDIIVKQKNFWSDRDEDVLRAIRDGYVNTHYAMWRELDKWPRTASGLPSTAGTTASIAFIRKGKIYIGHVGDSGIILGYQADGDPQWRAKALTKDHKPESGPEMIRIQESGGKVVNKSGVPRVVWNRPRIGHKGPVRRSTHIDEIPFLAVARSLGDLWSYNSELNTFVVSPEPDVRVVAVDVKSHRCLIFGTDGLWNMLSPQAAVSIVQAAERHNENHLIASQQTGAGQADDQMWINPSKSLVDRALERWSSTRLRADNTSVVTLMLDPPGPSRSEVLLNQKKEKVLSPRAVIHSAVPAATESIEKPVASIAKPNIPKPPASTNIGVPEHKQPDSSNDTNGCFAPTSNVENPQCSAEPAVNNPDLHENSNTKIELAPKEDIEKECVGESIQVAEVSSSDIQEETTDVKEETVETKDEPKEEDKVPKVEKLIEVEDACDSASTHNLDCKTPDIEQVTNVKEPGDESKSCGMIRQNAFSGTCDDFKPSLHFMSRLKRCAGIMAENNSHNNELKNNSAGLNVLHPKQHTIFSNLADAVRTVTRGHSLSMQNALNSASSTSAKSYLTVTSRFKARSTPPSIASNTEDETVRSALNRTTNATVGTKRRHSTVSQSVTVVEESCALQEPSAKRRTRSEDRRNPTDENVPANQTREEPNCRLSWPTTESSLTKGAGSSNNISVQERLPASNTFHRRSLGKKTTPAKTIRRSSITSSNRLQQLRGSFGLREWDQAKNNRAGPYNERRPSRSLGIMGSMVDLASTPQRWLRSDTMAATPVKTLRSRNVDITGHTISAQLVHHYDVVKQNRLSLPAKVKQSTGHGALQSGRVRSSSLSSSKLKQGSGNNGGIGSCSTISNAGGDTAASSGIAKRVKSPYNPSARSLTTRSRIKRLGK